jgi:hypothetical protein
MAKTYSEIDRGLAAFIAEQHMFFVATAPSSTAGHINLSPKGLETFAVLDPTTVAYLDLTGSGIETIAHLRENGRIVIVFCAFEGAPRILRLHGRGEAIEAGDPDFDELRARFPAFVGIRSVIRVKLQRIADSCGYGVPLYRFTGHRSQLVDWAQRQGPQGLADYRAQKNRNSIDGLPGLSPRHVSFSRSSGAAGPSGPPSSPHARARSMRVFARRISRMVRRGSR